MNETLQLTTRPGAARDAARVGRSAASQLLVPAHGTSILAPENRGLVAAYVRGAPLGHIPVLEATLDLTMRCNANCRDCIEREAMSGARHAVFSLGRLLALIARLKEVGVRAVKLYGGDPTCFRALGRVLHALAAQGMRVFLSTNGYLLDNFADDIAALKDHVRVRVSINAGSPGTHQLIFRTPRPWFATILSNAHQLARRGVDVSFSIVVRQETIGEIAAAARNARDVGARAITIKPLVSPTTKHLQLVPACLKDLALRDIGEAVALQDRSFRVVVTETMQEALAARTDADLVQPKPAGLCPFTMFRIVISPPGIVTSCPYHRASPAFVVCRDIARLGCGWLASAERQEGILRADPHTQCPFSCDRGEIALYLHAVKQRYQAEGEKALEEVPTIAASDGGCSI